MVDLPDYVKYIVQAPRDLIEVSLQYGDLTVQPMLTRPAILNGVDVKAKNALVTDYIKQCCIKPPGVTAAGPSGTMNSYEGGYYSRALILKNGTGERALAKECLDEWVLNQNADGSWSQLYYPVRNILNLHDEVEDIQVDSGAAVLIWAMADYDASIGPASTIYLAPVQKALSWLKTLQNYYYSVHGKSLLCNMVKDGVMDPTALMADCGEVLLAINAVLDQYGTGLTTSLGDSVKTIGNDLYFALGGFCYAGDLGRYWYTGYPPGQQTLIPFTYKEKLTLAQALTSWAVYAWYNGAHNTGADLTGPCEKTLDLALCLMHGKWGGFIYSPYYALADETRNEYPSYTAQMVLAMNAVNATKYAGYITSGIDFLKWLALADGRMFDFVRPYGELEIGRVMVAGVQAKEEFGFIGLNSALAILAGA
jgi:hypothetical protein